MSRQAAAMLTFNGLVALLLGLIAGAPYGFGMWGVLIAPPVAASGAWRQLRDAAGR